MPHEPGVDEGLRLALARIRHGLGNICCLMQAHERRQWMAFDAIQTQVREALQLLDEVMPEGGRDVR